MTRRTFTYLCTILCAVLFASIIRDVNAKTYQSSRSSHSSHSSHSYPSGNGLSGSHSSGTHSVHQSHSYPTHTSMGSSGGSITQHKYPSSHSYPSSNTLSGGSSGSSAHSSYSSNSISGGSSGVHSYPSPSRTAHGYPSSSSLSGGGSSAVHSSHSSTSVGSAHSYPSTNTLSGAGAKPGSSLYPPSPGLSGGSHYQGGSSSNHHFNNNNYHSNTWGSQPGHTNYNNYNNHHSTWGSQPVHQTNTHTVVHHHHYSYRPPSVIHYHSSSGIVSYPVYTGTLPSYVDRYSSSHNKYSYLLAGLALYNLGRMSSDSRMQSYHQHYIRQPDEYCKFGVRYRSGVSEEMEVDCRSITYFIYQDNQPGSLLSAEMNKNMQQATALVNTNTQQVLSSSGVLMQSAQPVNTITTTTTQTYAVEDPRFYGNPIDVRPDMECYVSRVARFSNIVKPVPCDLLQSYSKQSLHRRNSAPGLKSSYVALVVVIAFLMN